MRLIAILLSLSICMSLCGCSWMDGSYHSVTPHLPEKTTTKQDTITIDSEDQLVSALLQQVEQGSASAVIYCRKADEETLKTTMAAAVYQLSETNGIFAYAVDDILYEIGLRNSQVAISVQITYLHSKQELQAIRQAVDMDGVEELIGQALQDCDAGIVMRVQQYADMDITQYIQDYVDQNPHVCMEMPQVTVMQYPDFGEDRVLELNFAYQISRDALRNMQDAVQPVFASAKNYVNADADQTEQYSQLYAFLMGRDTYTVQTSLTPAYSLLKHGVGDSKAFAVVYAAMCRQSELDCRVVSGTYGGESRFWNVMKIGSTYYYLDLLTCNANDGFALKTADQMSDYVWDYSAY